MSQIFVASEGLYQRPVCGKWQVRNNLDSLVEDWAEEVQEHTANKCFIFTEDFFQYTELF